MFVLEESVRTALAQAVLFKRGTSPTVTARKCPQVATRVLAGQPRLNRINKGLPGFAGAPPLTVTRRLSTKRFRSRRKRVEEHREVRALLCIRYGYSLGPRFSHRNT